MEEGHELIERRITRGEIFAVPTERPGDFYLSLLGLREDRLKGKTILNIGAGGTDLGEDLKKIGVNVINCDLKYRQGKHGGVKSSKIVAGDMTALPFTENSVDIAVNLYAAGYLPKETNAKTLSEMVRVARESAVVYPCITNKAVLEFIKQNNLGSAVEVSAPTFDPRLVLANLDVKKGFFYSLARIIKNMYYTLDLEPLAKLFGAKRITINTEEFKHNPHWQQLTQQLINAGLILWA